MLYNKDWNKPKVTPKINPLSMDDFIAWLETQDPLRETHYTNSSECVLARWVQHLDPKAGHWAGAGSFEYAVYGKKVSFADTLFPKAVIGNLYGGVLALAKKYRGQT